MNKKVDNRFIFVDKRMKKELYGKKANWRVFRTGTDRRM